MKIEFVPRGSGSTLTLDDKAISSVNPVRTHTALGDFVVQIRGDRRLETRAQRQDRVHIKQGGTTQFTGFLTGVRHRSSGETELRGKGIGKLLQENRPDYANLSNGTKSYDNVFAGDAIEDYWSLTQFGTVSVTKQNGNIVVQDSKQQSADTTSEWNNTLQAIGDDVPLYVDAGKLKLAQTAHIAEAENNSPLQTTSGVEYSDGSAAQDLNNNGDTVFSFDFTVNYDIPANDWDVVVRHDKATDNGTGNVYDLKIDGTAVGLDGPARLLSWERRTAGFELTAGTHTLEMEITQIRDDQAIADVVGIVDNRYTYNFDNTVDSDNGHLDGPALYPTDANPVITTTATETTRNIVEATVTTTFDNTSNDQRLGLSDGGGATFERANNTNSFTATFSDAGRQLVTEFRLSGYDNGARNATPRFNYNGQVVNSFNTKVDLDDRIVLVGVELTKNHFDNLQRLHEISDYIWTIDHDDGDPSSMPVLSFPRGDESRTASVLNNNAIDESPEVNTSRFYNKIPVQGAEDNNGDRPFAVAKDSNSINNVGDEISPGLLRDPTLHSEVECRFKARALLDKALKNQELRGQKVVPGSVSLLPGASYSVGFLDDTPSEKVLEETRLRLNADGDAELTADFVAEETLRREIADLRRNQRQTADRL